MPFTNDRKQEIEACIHDYLKKHLKIEISDVVDYTNTPCMKLEVSLKDEPITNTLIYYSDIQDGIVEFERYATDYEKP